MRKWMNLFESESLFPATLESAWDIAEYISAHSPDWVDEELIAEYFDGARAVLQMVPVDELSEGPSSHNIRDAKREAKYKKLETAVPPLVVDDGVVMDGNHRLRVAISKGVTHLPCYVVEFPDD